MTGYSTHAIDTFIRESLSDDYRVGSDCIEPIQAAMETYVQTIVRRGWEEAQNDGRATLQETDVDIEQVPPTDSLRLSVSPTRELCKQELPDAARVSADTVVAVGSIVEEYGETIVHCAELFMRHADRKTLKSEDVDLYFELFKGLPE